MTISAVGQDGNSKLYTVASATAVGIGAGVAAKYALPVTKQESILSTRSMLNYCRKMTNRNMAAEFSAKKGNISRAEDVFVKMIESKDRDAFNRDTVTSRVKALGGETSLQGKEFRAIIRNANESAKSMTRKFARAYNFMLKDIRPTAPFIVAGAGIGFLTGFMRNVMRNDIDV